MRDLRILPARLSLLAALAALLALALLALAPATAQEPDGVPKRLTLNLELLNDSDGYVQAGSTISIRGQVRLEPSHNDLQISAGNLRLTADQAWEQTDRSLLAVNDQRLIAAASQTQASGAGTIGYITYSSTALPSGQRLRIIAYDGKTIVARARGDISGATETHIYVFNAETGAQIGRLRNEPRISGSNCYIHIDGSSCTGHPAARWGWGRQSDDDLGGAVAVWQEDEDTAWLFIGNFRAGVRQNAYNYDLAGGMWIYRVNYAPATPTVSYVRRFHSQRVELLSRGIIVGGGLGTPDAGHYGTSVAVSADGSTLAVGAPLMHNTGAVYVYSRPAGGWGASLGWNDAVRVSPVVIPAWGNNNSHHPFEPQSTGRTGANNHCDAYCSAVSSYAGDVINGNNQGGGARFGAHVALSADGSVLAVSAPRKRWASDTDGGSGVFRGTSRAEHGEVLIFTAPAGGWSSVPNYTTGRTHLAWNANAASFDPSMHYGTGPAKRVNEPTWTFSFPWDNQQAYLLGQKLKLSADGTVLAANDRINDAVNLFEVDSPSDWANGPTAPTAQLTGVADGGRAGEIGFSPDGLTFAIGDPTHNSNQGRVLLFQRPLAADNSQADWADAGVANAEILLAPTGQRVANDRFGRSLAWGSADPAAPRLSSLAVNAAEAANNGGSAVGPGRFWTVSREAPLNCPTNVATDAEGDEIRTRVCTLDLGDTSIVIPTGTPDGPFVISGAVTLRYGIDPDGEPLTVQRTANIELQIGDVQEVAKVQMDFAVDDNDTPAYERDDIPYPRVLSARGSSTMLRLQILNEHDKASAAGSVASVIVTATAGSLSTTFGGGCATSGGGVSCRIDASMLSANNADKIPITLTHQGREGTARISALVIATDGMSYESEPQEVVLAGTPRTLEIAEPSADLLNVDDVVGLLVSLLNNSAFSPSDRDILTLTVTARDRVGAAVSAPDRTYSYRITGPDGKQVASSSAPSSKIAVTWPIPGGNLCAIRAGTASPPTLADGSPLLSTYTGTGTTAQALYDIEGVPICIWDPRLPAPNRWRAWEPGDADITISRGTILALMTRGLTRTPALADGQPQIRLDVNAVGTAALAAGEYTLEVRQAGLPWASQTIRLAGYPAEISFAALDAAPALNEEFTVTATVTDADGNPVPDGTAVEWSSAQASGGATLVILGEDRTTTDGQASSTWLAAASGSGWVRATAFSLTPAGAVERVRKLQTVTIPAQQVDLVDLLSRGAAPGFGVWRGPTPIQASKLVAGVEGVSGISVLRSNPTRWLTYAVDNGQLRPNSLDFPIRPNDIYWLE